MLDLKNKIILAICAHPDDNDFSAAGTFAKAAKLGAKIHYLIATKGGRGSADPKMTSKRLMKLREEEQIDAGKIIGLKSVKFLNFKDGEVSATNDLREKIVRHIREIKPDIVFTMDPAKLYYSYAGFVNHSDHRAVGLATMDSVYPLARDRMSYPKHEKLGLKPHKTKELLFYSLEAENANYFEDVTNFWEIKKSAILAHKSQVGDGILNLLEIRAKEIGKFSKANYSEGFVRIKFSH